MAAAETTGRAFIRRLAATAQPGRLDALEALWDCCGEGERDRVADQVAFFAYLVATGRVGSGANDGDGCEGGQS